MAEETAQFETKLRNPSDYRFDPSAYASEFFDPSTYFLNSETAGDHNATSGPLENNLKCDTISKDRTSANWVPKEQFNALERGNPESCNFRKIMDTSEGHDPKATARLSREAFLRNVKHGKRSRNNKRDGRIASPEQSKDASPSESSDISSDEQEAPASRLKRVKSQFHSGQVKALFEAVCNHNLLSTGELSALQQTLQDKINYQEVSRPMKDSTPIPGITNLTWRTLHCIEDDTFLEPPQYREGERGAVYRLDKPLRNVDFYLEQHPEIVFIFYKKYEKKPPSDVSLISSPDGVFREPEPYNESLSLVSGDIISVVKRVKALVPGFHKMFPDFDVMEDISSPYMFMFYSLPLLKSQKLGSKLDPFESHTFSILENAITSRYGEEYADAKDRADKGKTSRRLIKYLVKPGDVLIKKGAQPRAYIATSWATEFSDQTELQGFLDDKATSHLRQNKPQQWKIEVWSLEFDGNFQKTPSSVYIELSTAEDDQEVEIESLNYFPIRYDTNETRRKLESRGRTFWKCRKRFFIMYQEPDYGYLSNIGERYMIDIDTYKTLHSDSPLSKMHLRADITLEDMSRDQPPDGDILLVFPPSITGYQLRQKKWVDLEVDRISDVKWNKQAFETLVASEKTKELIEALVTSQLKADKSTDFIAGKGNGLIILLHGGPGTGKTFTAEGVAELAEKPLFRVTCGDVGTKPEDVEKYLESVLNLGRVWDCVVLLDEADVFLEERGLADLQRNALVSVFLRVLEYNVGILILTSNRVGTFDEAFKSRIQLALHYENLTGPQQRKIWQNFLDRLKILDGDKIDYEGIIGNLEELGKEDMNGRQIRNAITTARQLAQYKDKKFSYDHLKHVICVGGKFEKYLKAMREGVTDDLRMREDGIR